MARFLVDTFATNHPTLNNRTPETGGSWVSVVGIAESSAGRAQHATVNTDNVLYRNTAAPADADYWVEAPLYRASASTQMAGPAGRIDPGGGQFDWYMAQLDDSQDELQLISVAGGSPTELGAVAVAMPTVGTSEVVRLTMDGNQISADYAGSTVIGPVTNSVHTAAGQAGLFISYLAGTSDTVGLHLASIEAENDLSAAPPTYTGDLTADSQAAAADLSGTYAPPEYAGSLGAVSESGAASFAGTYDAPGYDGALIATAGAVAADFSGTYAPPEYAGGFTAASQPGVADFAGTYVSPEYAGALAADAGAADATFTGAYEPPPGGVLEAASGAASAAFAGTYALPAYVGALEASAAGASAQFAGTYAVPVYVGAMAAVSEAASARFTEARGAQGYLSGTTSHSPALAATVTHRSALSASVERRFGLFATITRRP